MVCSLIIFIIVTDVISHAFSLIFSTSMLATCSSATRIMITFSTMLICTHLSIGQICSMTVMPEDHHLCCHTVHSSLSINPKQPPHKNTTTFSSAQYPSPFSPSPTDTLLLNLPTSISTLHSQSHLSYPLFTIFLSSTLSQLTISTYFIKQLLLFIFVRN